MSERFETAPGCGPLLAAIGLRDLKAVFDWRQGQRLDKPGLEPWRQRWRLRLPGPDAVERTLYLKRFDQPPLHRQLQRWRAGRLTCSTAGVEWANARHLGRAGISAVEPVAFGQQMCGLWERRSFILLQEVAGESLERWVPANLPPQDQERDRRRRRARVDQLARFVAAFHAAGFVHRDLYLSHVFIQPAIVQENERFCLIDLQRVFQPRWRQRRWVVKDLAALDFSAPRDRIGRRERLQFLCRYVRQCNRFGSARQLARLIETRTRRMERRTPRPSAG